VHRPILSLVVDRACARGDVRAAVEAAVRGGVDWVQVRERDLDDRALLEHADVVASAVRRGARERELAPRVLVNRRADVALAIGADGVHLGFDAMDARDARDLLGQFNDEALLGLSAHAAGEIAATPGLSYAHLAPIFAPLSKAAARAPLGLSALAEAAAEQEIPVLAQGGIDRENARAAIAAGAAGVAVTGAILLADDPEQATRALREALDG
jgi:thiamine-phosphate diphosphorylase